MLQVLKPGRIQENNEEGQKGRTKECQTFGPIQETANEVRIEAKQENREVEEGDGRSGPESIDSI